MYYIFISIENLRPIYKVLNKHNFILVVKITLLVGRIKTNISRFWILNSILRETINMCGLALRSFSCNVSNIMFDSSF